MTAVPYLKCSRGRGGANIDRAVAHGHGANTGGNVVADRSFTTEIPDNRAGDIQKRASIRTGSQTKTTEHIDRTTTEVGRGGSLGSGDERCRGRRRRNRQKPLISTH